MEHATRQIVEFLQNRITGKIAPIVVALDGGSGAGKSTLAASIKKELDITVIPLDDFFSAGIPDYEWDRFTVGEKLKHVFDWSRVREEVIVPLLQGQPARWHAFDFQAGTRPDGTYAMQTEWKTLQPASVILIEGAYSAGPALADLVDLSIFVDVPAAERHRRLAAREDPNCLEKWHQRWDEVELYYFKEVRPRESFELVVELK